MSDTRIATHRVLVETYEAVYELTKHREAVQGHLNPKHPVMLAYQSSIAKLESAAMKYRDEVAHRDPTA
ncbi:hypothetical protein LMG24235_01899 [Paraburkholderia sabiae]|nr:hypothetical protein LMG24235_01899 [Paraburkholderia sabiae]